MHNCIAVYHSTRHIALVCDNLLTYESGVRSQLSCVIISFRQDRRLHVNDIDKHLVKSGSYEETALGNITCDSKTTLIAEKGANCTSTSAFLLPLEMLYVMRGNERVLPVNALHIDFYFYITR